MIPNYVLITVKLETSLDSPRDISKYMNSKNIVSFSQSTDEFILLFKHSIILYLLFRCHPRWSIFPYTFVSYFPFLVSVLTTTFGAKITTNFTDKLPRNIETLRSAKAPPTDVETFVSLLRELAPRHGSVNTTTTSIYAFHARRKQNAWGSKDNEPEPLKPSAIRTLPRDPRALNLGRCSDCRKLSRAKLLYPSTPEKASVSHSWQKKDKI